VIDTHDWLEAIDNHPDLDGLELLAGYEHLGVATDLDEAQIGRSTFHLTLYGFVEPVSVDGEGTYNYELRMPA